MVAEKWCDGGGGRGEDGGSGGDTDGGGYTPCVVPALNYWDTTRSMSQKENGCAAWNDGLSRRSYIMHAAVSALWLARMYSCANVQKKEENTLPRPRSPPCRESHGAFCISRAIMSCLFLVKWKKREARRGQDLRRGEVSVCRFVRCAFPNV